VIGVYEPTIWLLADGTTIEGSLAARPSFGRDAGAVSAFHRGCAPHAASGADLG
jgi:hypothetical protein